MNKKFKSGITYTLLYYATGILFSWVVFQLIGKHSNAFPGAHHFVLLFFLTGGITWIFYYYALSLAKQKYKINYGSLTVHLISMIMFILFTLIYIYKFQ